MCERKDDAVDPRFAVLVEALAPKLDELLARVPLQYGNLPRDMPFSGVYLFSEGARHLYVGRSNSLRGRYGRHCRPGATHRQAALHSNSRMRPPEKPLPLTVQVKAVEQA